MRNHVDTRRLRLITGSIVATAATTVGLTLAATPAQAAAPLPCGVYQDENVGLHFNNCEPVGHLVDVAYADGAVSPDCVQANLEVFYADATRVVDTGRPC